MTLDELKDYLRKSGIKDFNVVTNPVGPDDEWTEAEQEEDCCQLVPDHDPCVEVGKTEPWNGWTEEEKQELGWYPKPGQTTPEELLANAEQKYGKGNVHLKIRETGPRPCGEKVTRWGGSLSCCTSPTELVKFSGATTAAPDDTETYRVLGGTGEPPITWDVIGAGATVAKTDATSARANFDNCFCNPVVIYAQDTCLSVAPWVVGRSGGSWASIDDESLSSPFGWYQDGTTGSFFVTGFNGDNTKVSTQHYWQAEYVGTKEVVCGTTMPGINENPIVTPADGSQAFEKCENANIWVRLREGFSNVWEVRYAIDSQSTSEFTHTCQDNPLEFDYDNSADVIADYGSGYMVWAGGEPPFSVTVGGVEFYLDAGRTTTEVYNHPNRSIKVYAGDSCGGGDITITDACGSSVSGKFRAADGRWIIYQTAANNEGGLDYPDNGPYPPIPLPHATTVVMDGGMPAGGIYGEIGYWKGWNPIQTSSSVWNDTEAEAQANLDAVCAAGAAGVYSPVVITDTITVHHFYVGTTGDYTSCGNGVYVHDDGITGPNIAGRWSFTYAVLWDFFAYSSSSVGLRVDKWVC